MQKYLLPNDNKMKKEDCEQIFKIRSRVTQAKVNQKNRYETYECEACEIADESQEHILKCEVILKMQQESEQYEKLEYEKIMNGNVNEQYEIAKLFKKNMDIIEDIRKKKLQKNENMEIIQHPLRDQVTSESAVVVFTDLEINYYYY